VTQYDCLFVHFLLVAIVNDLDCSIVVELLLVKYLSGGFWGREKQTLILYNEEILKITKKVFACKKVNG
jgi:hypothetical protein